MTTTITYHGFVTDTAHGRDRHDVRIAGPMARVIATWFARHPDAVRSSNQCLPDQIRTDVFGPPKGWVGPSDVSDVLLWARLEHPCAGAMTYVDLRDSLDPCDVVDLRRF